jgi:hypothetical protein
VGAPSSDVVPTVTRILEESMAPAAPPSSLAHHSDERVHERDDSVVSPTSASQSRLLSLLLGLDVKKTTKAAQTPPRQEVRRDSAVTNFMDHSDSLMTPPGFSNSFPSESRTPEKTADKEPPITVKAEDQHGVSTDYVAVNNKHTFDVPPARMTPAELSVANVQNQGTPSSGPTLAPAHYQGFSLMPNSFMMQQSPYGMSSAGYYMPHGGHFSMPSSMPSSLPQNIPQSMPLIMPQNMTQNMTQNATQSMQQNLTQNMMQNMTQNTTQNMPHTMQHNMVQHMVQHMPQIMPNIAHVGPQGPIAVPAKARYGVPASVSHIPSNVYHTPTVNFSAGLNPTFSGVTPAAMLPQAYNQRFDVNQYAGQLETYPLSRGGAASAPFAPQPAPSADQWGAALGNRYGTVNSGSDVHGSFASDFGNRFHAHGLPSAFPRGSAGYAFDSSPSTLIGGVAVPVSEGLMHRRGLSNNGFPAQVVPGHSSSVGTIDNNAVLRAALGINPHDTFRRAELSSGFEGVVSGGARNRNQSVDSEMSFNHESIVDGALSRSPDHTPPQDASLTATVMAAQDPVTATASGPQRVVFRTTRNQPGTMTLYLARGKHQPNVKCETDNFSVRPGTHLIVDWQLPAGVFDNRVNDTLVIGILRYGSLANQPAIVVKQVGPLSTATVKATDMFGNVMVKGSIPFHAPKGSGRFVFRMFNNSANKSVAAITLATSVSYSVDLVDVDVTSNLRFSLDAFQDGQNAKAVQQLTCTVVAIRNGGKLLRGDDPKVLLHENMSYALELVDKTSATADTAREKALMERGKKDSSMEDGNDRLVDAGKSGSQELDPTKKSEDESFWAAARVAHRLQADLMEFFVEASKNRIVWSLLSETVKDILHTKMNLFCSILNRFFKDEASLNQARLSEFGYIPAYPLRVLPAGAKFPLLDRLLSVRAPSLFPPASFESDRDRLRSNLEAMINEGCVFPVSCKLHLYGSSSNMFGNESADVDMCLSFSPTFVVPAESKAGYLENLGRMLTSVGMLEVTVRTTARIPIVNFVDPVTLLDCDISYFNPLAICNTKLLRSYCQCDQRVRPLAYLIKAWAKARKINSPGDGTLGSYGYILCLIHYLQTRRVPVLPYLQRLPKSWRGEDTSLSSSTRLEDPMDALEEHDIELHPVDNTPCRTYFYNVNSEESIRYARAFSGRNKDSIAQLLLGFFQYFAWDFDFKHDVVSTTHSPQSISKITKAEQDCWTQHDRLRFVHTLYTSNLYLVL